MSLSDLLKGEGARMVFGGNGIVCKVYDPCRTGRISRGSILVGLATPNSEHDEYDEITKTSVQWQYNLLAGIRQSWSITVAVVVVIQTSALVWPGRPGDQTLWWLAQSKAPKCRRTIPIILIHFSGLKLYSFGVKFKPNRLITFK